MDERVRARQQVGDARAEQRLPDADRGREREAGRERGPR